MKISKAFHLGFRLAYDGSRYRGFQSQVSGDSVQDAIERALSIFFRKKIRIDFSSRTDAGVHAWDQWVVVRDGFSLYQLLNQDQQKRLIVSLNALLGGDIVVWRVLKLKRSFNIKKDIASKEYHYRVLQGLSNDPLDSSFAWHIRSPLDLSKMQRQIKNFVGKHDFSAFASSSTAAAKKLNARKRIFSASVATQRHPRIFRLLEYRFRFQGSGFLYRMVRNMVGVLIEAGRGKDVSVKRMFRTHKRPSHLCTAPAQGLILVRTVARRRSVLKTLASILFFGICVSASVQAEGFTGSFQFSAQQRFFDDARLGHVNGFSEWGAIEFRLMFGLVDLPFHLEPIVGVSMIKNSAPLYKIDDSGSYILDANGNPIKSEIDQLQYQLYSGLAGLRWKGWDPSLFFLIPYAEVLHEFRYGRVRKQTYAVDQQNLNTGFDLGFQLGGGVLFSFLFDDRIRSDIETEWLGARDFALISSIHWLPPAYYRNGLGLVDSLGGWDFGLGIFMDW